MSGTENKNPGIVAALLGPLDDDTRRNYGLDTSRPIESSAPAGRPARMRDLGPGDLWSIIRATVASIGEDRVSSVAGGVTFFGLLSLFPAITAFVSLYGLLSDPAGIEGQMDLLDDLLPASALEIIRGQVVAIASAPTSALSVAGLLALLIAFWSANGGMKALLSALNVAVMQGETRGFVRLNLVAMTFTLGGLLMIALMLVVIAVVPAALQLLPVGWGAETLITYSRWPIMFAVLIMGLAAIYRWGPAVPDSRWRWISPGAIMAAVGLVVISMLFSWYAANFANYNETYGSLGAVIALMIWLWLNATIVLVGAELNAEVERHLKRKAGIPANRPVRKRKDE
ncbi:YihY/virulence factor BrkB family protein [Paracoccus sp. 1_MG-2023]|uniref:YihY/virulence factor BrkB family protein n=1 Tax=unclassified Paracoccus (in: a-proteobacteria) TaxID=2688777 RepID=UPI001C0A5F1A|nr:MULTISPECIES: YihY/virulence factor BrkB family protein [unclassified Paracoccus (in: a-proteobacteria)]MBU2959057.1 YihY/virulence factor BrkB family protein [Paracoccus sp. C2R09]MDO6669030.1 YihY/virulence factor BrkB family protein [Paracoccus sp. 1_MG-2023]